MRFVIARATPSRAVRCRYLRSVQARPDGSIMAIGYGSRDEAQVFAQEHMATRLIAQLAEHPVFSLDALKVEAMAPSAMAHA